MREKSTNTRLAFFVLVVGVLTYKVLADRNSKYPFAKEEMDRYHG